MAWDGYDLNAIKKNLEPHGVEVKEVGAHRLDLRALDGRRRIAAFYSSSQAAHYKQYLQDLVSNLHFMGAVLYPGLEHMLAHEDKAYQAMRLSRTNLRTPRTFVFGYRDHAYEFLRSATFPLVGKTPHGFGSSGVRLIRNAAEGRRWAECNMIHRALDKGRPLYKRVWQRLMKPSPCLGLIVFQEFIPDLPGDWKILIWGDLACGGFRENRPQEFRASGSGRTRYVELPIPVLDFAFEALGELELPWGSFDVTYDGRQCALLEYQGLHFGLTFLDKGQFHYKRHGSGWWEKRIGKLPLEEQVAHIIRADMIRRGWISQDREPEDRGLPCDRESL